MQEASPFLTPSQAGFIARGLSQSARVGGRGSPYTTFGDGDGDEDGDTADVDEAGDNDAGNDDGNDEEGCGDDDGDGEQDQLVMAVAKLTSIAMLVTVMGTVLGTLMKKRTIVTIFHLCWLRPAPQIKLSSLYLLMEAEARKRL